MKPNHLTHPWKVEVWSHLSAARSRCDGQMLFRTEAEAQAYAEDIEDSCKNDEDNTTCYVLRSRPGDVEFA